MESYESEFVSDNVVEDDSCTKEEIDLAFSVQYSLQHNEVVSSKSTYLLQLCGNNEALIATGLSNHNIIIYDIETLKAVGSFGHDRGITGLRFSPKNNSLLYSSSLDGSIKSWDIRNNNGGYVSEFTGKWNKDDGSYVRHALTAFDVCNRDRILVAGTQSDGIDSFLLFWDVRSSMKPVGGYWESQSEDITQVTFHPSQSDLLAAGSMDGLINIFDIRQSCEDDALSSSLNTEATVDRISWLRNYKHGDSSQGDKFLSCVTLAETLQIWEAEEPSQLENYSRSDIATSLKVNSSEDAYVTDVIYDREFHEEVLVLGGSFKSECLRIMYLRDGELKPWACLNGANQVARCCWGNPKTGILATGGERGMLSLWRPEGSDGDSTAVAQGTHKIRVKKRNKKNVNPY